MWLFEDLAEMRRRGGAVCAPPGFVGFAKTVQTNRSLLTQAKNKKNCRKDGVKER